MDKNKLKEYLENLSEDYYFEETEDNSLFLCEDGMDLGIDLRKNTVKIYPNFKMVRLDGKIFSEKLKPIVMEYDDKDLLNIINQHLKIE